MSEVKRVEVSAELGARVIEIVRDIKAKVNHDVADLNPEKYTSASAVEKLISAEVDIPVARDKSLVHFPHDHNLKLIRFLMELYPGKTIMPSGNFIYPKNGYMGWHTNSDFPCRRVYITIVDEIGKSGFKYVNRGAVIDDVDDAQVIMREFMVGDKNILWHCVYSHTNRYSFGFRIEG